jgi:hypothetical protein
MKEIIIGILVIVFLGLLFFSIGRNTAVAPNTTATSTLKA